MSDLRTAEQKQMMSKLLPMILSGMERGATPFGGQLTRGPDKGMLDAMNMMSWRGGQGPYQYPGMQTGPYGGGGGGLPGGGGGSGVGGSGSGEGTGPYDREWWENIDPYAPGERKPRPGPPGREILPV